MEYAQSLAEHSVQNTEPDLIKMFELEGPGAIEANIRAAACWLYYMSFEEDLISEK